MRPDSLTKSPTGAILSGIRSRTKLRTNRNSNDGETNMRKHGLKALGLALMAAIGLMAFSATSALAVAENPLNLGDNFYSNNETPPEWLINSGTLSPVGLATQAIAGAQIGKSRFEVPAKKFELVCNKAKATGTVANEYENWKTGAMATGAHGHATLTFEECEAQEITEAGALVKKLANCTPNGGTIVAEVLLLGKKHKEPVGGTAKTYILAVPLVNTKAKAEANEALTSAFTTITFPELCALPSPTKITGSLSFLAPTADAVKPILKIDTLAAGTENELIGTKLKFGASDAHIQGEAQVELVGKNVPWGVM